MELSLHEPARSSDFSPFGPPEGGTPYRPPRFIAIKRVKFRMEALHTLLFTMNQ